MQAMDTAPRPATELVVEHLEGLILEGGLAPGDNLPSESAIAGELALSRLAARLAAALRVPKHRRPTKPTKASRRRRLDAKRRTGERKQARRRWSSED